MRLRLAALTILLCSFLSRAEAHIGSPDVFYEGQVGAYTTSITIRMPPVVPGQAHIFVQMGTREPVAVSFLPLFYMTSVKNAPPADAGRPVPGQPNKYEGELWLMSSGAYSIEVQIQGKAGRASIQIPVNSVATSQLPLPLFLKVLLAALGVGLVGGGAAIVAAATGEAVLPAGQRPGTTERLRGLVGCSAALLLFALLLLGGSRWWGSEERIFRRHLHEGAWPDLAASARVAGSQRVLHLVIGAKAFASYPSLPLIPDHGKLLHFFMIREPDRDSFAHLHPVRTGGKTFDVALPPLPEGEYKIFCDMTLGGSGFSGTGTASVRIPALPPASPENALVTVDRDDSWAINTRAIETVPDTDAVCPVGDGLELAWKAHGALHAQKDAAMRFEARDATGRHALLEPYMGMLSHAAVLREDGAVFDHLHPSGNYSMAAQAFFERKMRMEAGGAAPEAEGMADMPGMNHPASGASVITIPYEFPSPGSYRVWVQFKTGGNVHTAAFQTVVLPASPAA